MANKKFIFLGGLHRSGTSFISQLLANSDRVSTFSETGFAENEGQYLQSVLLREEDSLGVGSFGYHPDAHMDESHLLATEETATKLYNSWAEYWDTDKAYLLEKTPKNLLRTRFLQKLFPDSTFIMVMRNPLVVALATMKWDKSTSFSQITHWLHCYEKFLADCLYLDNAYLVRYEDLVGNTNQVLSDLLHFLDLPDFQYEDCYLPLISEIQPICRGSNPRDAANLIGRRVTLECADKSIKSTIQRVVKSTEEDGTTLVKIGLESGDLLKIFLDALGEKLVKMRLNDVALTDIEYRNSKTAMRISSKKLINFNTTYLENMESQLERRPRYLWDQKIFKDQRQALEKRVNAFGYSLYHPEAITQPKWLQNRHGGLLKYS